MNRMFCDRCGKDLTLLSAFGLRWERQMIGGPPKATDRVPEVPWIFDLCVECAQDFKVFLTEGGS